MDRNIPEDTQYAAGLSTLHFLGRGCTELGRGFYSRLAAAFNSLHYSSTTAFVKHTAQELIRLAIACTGLLAFVTNAFYALLNTGRKAHGLEEVPNRWKMSYHLLIGRSCHSTKEVLLTIPAVVCCCVWFVCCSLQIVVIVTIAVKSLGC